MSRHKQPKHVAAAGSDWSSLNQAYLAAALAIVHAALLNRLPSPGEPVPKPETLQRNLAAAAASLPAPAALQRLCDSFKLSPFERDILLLCAGCELAADFPKLCAVAQGDDRRAHATFSLALAALPNAHWSALAPASPLRKWRLIDVVQSEHFTSSPLRIEERVLHFLAGIVAPDSRLHGLLDAITLSVHLPASQLAIARQLAAVWERFRFEGDYPAIQLTSRDPASAANVASAAASALSIELKLLRAADIPVLTHERESFARLLEREMILGNFVVLVEVERGASTVTLHAAISLLDVICSPMLVAYSEPIRLRTRALARLEIPSLAPVEQHELWRHALGEAIAAGLNGEVDLVSTQFRLDPSTILIAAGEVTRSYGKNGSQNSSSALWDACRDQSRPRLDGLARRIEAFATWDELVLPAVPRQTLQTIVAHVRQRSRVYEQWGFAERGDRGLGISALFTGSSGTGKTMAAEVLANELRLDLYRIDLSALVSKYIGETEKNLRELFDSAETGGAILLFDEADAIFGRRSEVRDSHDRYANIGVGYLLQRIETYRGLVVLTTNQPQALDPAFSRRIRFTIQFPFPDLAHRAEIWRRAFPKSAPTEALQVEKLARLNLAGGHIRNVALNAAFLAADAGEPVRMKHLLTAAQSEFTKLEKPLSATETAGWV